jgi:hypothetical protein
VAINKGRGKREDARGKRQEGRCKIEKKSN